MRRQRRARRSNDWAKRRLGDGANGTVSECGPTIRDSGSHRSYMVLYVLSVSYRSNLSYSLRHPLTLSIFRCVPVYKKGDIFLSDRVGRAESSCDELSGEFLHAITS